MKKGVAFVLAVLMLASFCTGLAEGRQAPEDKDILTTDVIQGFETVYRKYDAKFYDAPSQQPGTVEKLTYTSEVYGKQTEGWLNVYLPFGYDREGSERYNILYFYHGTNEDPNSFIGDERVKNFFDNIMEVGLCEPFIAVFPTYYYDYEKRACDLELFQQEMRQDIMPAVESTYRTYAETADEAGFVASRTHRAISGYSQGCRMCWFSFMNLLDCAYYFLPLSNGTGAEQVFRSLDQHPEYRDAFFIYSGCGGKRDGMADANYNMINALAAKPEYFSFGNDVNENNLYLTVSKDLHQTLVGRYFLYNAICDVLWKK